MSVLLEKMAEPQIRSRISSDFHLLMTYVCSVVLLMYAVCNGPHSVGNVVADAAMTFLSFAIKNVSLNSSKFCSRQLELVARP
jgi:hypothetical protein